MLWPDMLAAFGAAVLAGLGVGSGGLLVVYLTLCAGLEQRAAQGVNLLFFLASGGTALGMHLTGRRLYPLVIVWMTLFGLGGSFLGTALSRIIPPTWLRYAFGAALMASALPRPRRGRRGKEAGDRR